MRRARAQEGFTLIELLVAMAIALTVLAATLSALTVFSNDSNAVTERNAAQNQARLAIDRIVSQLRNIASPLTSPKWVERATEYDLVFETIGTPSTDNPQGTERVRYCVPADTNPGTASDEAVYVQTQTWSTATPPDDPWSSDPTVTIACPDPSYPAVLLAGGVTNRYQGADRCVFSYDDSCTTPQDLSTINTVGIDLFVNPTPRLPDAETELRSSAFLRNQQPLPVASFTYTPVGGGSVLLNAGTSYSSSGDTLSYSWSCSGSPCSSTGSTFDWQPGTGTYTVTLTVTDQAGLQATTSQGVTVT